MTDRSSGSPSHARLHVIRHAPVAIEGLCYGRTDVPVSLEPQEAFASIADLPNFEVLWTSPASRCRQLAELIAERNGASLCVDQRICEMDFGDWDGIPWADISAEELNHWMLHWKTHGPPGGETLREHEARVRDWEASLDSAQSHLLVSHAGVVRALWVIREALTWEAAFQRIVPWLVPARIK